MTAISNLHWGVVVFSSLILVCCLVMWIANRKMSKFEEHSIEYALYKHFNMFMFWVLMFNIFMLILVVRGIYADPEIIKFARI